MSKQDVKTNLLSHSEAKVKLLGEYLKRYLSIISNDGYTQRIKIYDLFCGEGLYANGGEGSPLVILNEVKNVYFTNQARSKKTPSIDCRFNDIEPTKTQKVGIAIKDKSLHYDFLGEIEYSNNDYQLELEALYKVLPNLKNQKAFIFIDPYEYKHIKANQIKKLMTNGNAEVLLWLPTQQMYRFSKNGTPEALHDFIMELTKYKEWKRNDSVWSFVTQLKEGFQNYLGSDFFVDSFSIEKDANTVYCLYFFTSHIKGFEKMLEAKWKIDTENGKGWEYSGNSLSLFPDDKTNELEDKLKIYLQTKRYNGEVYEFTLRQGFLPKHTNQIFEIWQKKGTFEVYLMENKQARKKAFYISYEYYKEEYQKVYYKLK